MTEGWWFPLELRSPPSSVLDRDVLMRIRIQIRGSKPLFTDPAPDPNPDPLFSSVAFNTLIKNMFFYPLLIIFWRYICFQSSKITSYRYRTVLKSLKGIEMKAFFLVDGRIRIQEAEKYRLRIWIRNTASKQYSTIMRPSLSGAALFFFYEAIISLHSQRNIIICLISTFLKSKVKDREANEYKQHSPDISYNTEFYYNL